MIRTRGVGPVFAPLAGALLLAVALAGCTDDAGDADAMTDTMTQEALTKGVLRGVVVDEAIRPLADAVVQVKRAGVPVVEVATDADGNFGVPNLDAGNYSVNATKPGYLGNEVPAVVVGGDNLPPIVQILLQAAPVDAAFVWPHLWNGQVACGTTTQNWCAAINFVSGIEISEDNSFLFLFDDYMAYGRTPDFLQVEFVWEPNSPASNWAYAGFWASTWEEWEDCLCTPNILATVEGSGYILVQVEGSAMAEFDVGFTRGIGVGMSAGQAGLDAILANPDRTTVMVNQPFEAFLHTFYGCLPEPGWQFTLHGDPTCDPTSLDRAEGASA
jgi:hypothetical protein